MKKVLRHTTPEFKEWFEHACLYFEQEAPNYNLSVDEVNMQEAYEYWYDIGISADYQEFVISYIKNNILS
jgi:hypothetical protein